jgi:hypothetical protein
MATHLHTKNLKYESLDENVIKLDLDWFKVEINDTIILWFDIENDVAYDVVWADGKIAYLILCQ